MEVYSGLFQETKFGKNQTRMPMLNSLLSQHSRLGRMSPIMVSLYR